MGTNRDVITSSHQHSRDMASDQTAGLAVVALLLVLVLGFSAVDIQRQQAPDAHQVDSVSQERGLLDGRGKWGGYL